MQHPDEKDPGNGMVKKQKLPCIVHPCADIMIVVNVKIMSEQAR